jgi:hypothetical protein
VFNFFQKKLRPKSDRLLAATKSKTQRINCVNNLKQVGIAFRTWEGLNGGRYPMAVSYALGGTSEYLTHANGNNPPVSVIVASALTPGMTFLVMSNQLSAPRLLYCPSDNIHFSAPTNWNPVQIAGISTLSHTGLSTAQNLQSSVSYFVNADATEADPQSILSGDCNIGSTGAVGASSASTLRFGYGTTAQYAQLPTAAYNGPTTGFWAWTQSDLHQKTGNLLVADGGVQQTTIPTLHTFLNSATNSVQYPCFNFIY